MNGLTRFHFNGEGATETKKASTAMVAADGVEEFSQFADGTVCLQVFDGLPMPSVHVRRKIQQRTGIGLKPQSQARGTGLVPNSDRGFGEVAETLTAFGQRHALRSTP